MRLEHSDLSRRRAMRALAAGMLAAFLTVTAGCGTAENPSAHGAGPPHSRDLSANPAGASPAESPKPEIDVSVISDPGIYDYEALPSVTAVMRRSPSVTLGEVVGWSDGRSLVEGYPDGSYTDISRFAILEVRTLTSYKALDGQDDADRVFVEVERGGEIRVDGQRPDGSEPVLTDIAELEQAVPAGTRVIIAAGEAPTSEEHTRAVGPGTAVREAPDARPSGYPLLWPDIQGLLIEEREGGFASGLTPGDEDSWGWLPDDTRTSPDGFDHLVAELDAAAR